MVEGAFDSIFNPLGVKPTAVIGCIPGCTKAALRKSQRSHLAQRGDVVFRCPLSVCPEVVRNGEGQIDFAFNQLKT
ncbi:hypothetical protein D3C87_1574930 [compost metagenome]